MFKHALRTVVMLIAVALFALPVFAQTGDVFRVTATTMNARTGPGIEYPVVARLARGGSYSILQYSPTANWVLLDLGSMQAWAFRHLGEVEGTVPTFTMPTTTTATNPNASLGQGGGFIPTVTTTMPTTTETGVDLTVTQTQEQFNSTIGVTGTLRMRIEPTFSARILTVIPYDQRATPIGRNVYGTWIQVDYDGTVGWVYFLYVSFPPAIDVTALPVTG